MPVTTTLKALRDEGACVEGYNKLVRTLQGREFTDDDASRDSHIRYAHKDSITLKEILDSNGLDDALWSLRACEQTPDFIRACRLYAVWCARQVQHLMKDHRNIDALDVAEQHAHGAATDAELYAACAAARNAACAAARDAARDAALDAALAAALAAAWDAARGAALDAALAAALAAAWDAARGAALASQKNMFIDVFCGDEINIEAMSCKTTTAG